MEVVFFISHQTLTTNLQGKCVAARGENYSQIFGVEGVKFLVIGFDCILEKRVELILIE